MTVRVDVAPPLLAWAVQRAGLDSDAVTRKFSKFPQWVSGEHAPTLKQLEEFARVTRTSIGYFFLPEPPDEKIPIPDLRTVGDRGIQQPSPDLLDTIYQCQQRQDWYSEHARSIGLDPILQVGSMSTTTTIKEAAAVITSEMEFTVKRRGSNWSEAFGYLRDKAEDSGVLVMVSGVVGSNTRRKLNPAEFRGFALTDSLAPLVFVNGADTKAAQIFTLAHELAHIWMGESALSDTDLTTQATHQVERWCNGVAAEILVPLEALKSDFDDRANLTDELNRLARQFKSSTLVVLRRMHEAEFLNWDDYLRAYRAESERVRELASSTGVSGGGGDFYNTQPTRVSKRFARSVIVSTLEGRTLYTEALQMLGVKKLATFNQMAERLGVM